MGMSRTEPALTRQVATLSAAGAMIALAAAEAAARDRGLKLSLSVVDPAGNLLAFVRLDGAPVSTIEASLGKARTAALLGTPSKAFEDMLHGGATVLLAFDSVTPCQGGVPIVLDGVVVGGVGGSGGSGEEDEFAAQAGAAAVIATAAGT
jgi:glc operon protein GlcG